MFFKILKTLPFKIFNTWFNINLVSFIIRDRLSDDFFKSLNGYNAVLFYYLIIFFLRIIQQKLCYNISVKQTLGNFIVGAKTFKIWFFNNLKYIFRKIFGIEILVEVLSFYKDFKKKHSDYYVFYLNSLSILFVKFVRDYDIYFF